MYTPCLPLTRSDECVHVVGQYMKPVASTPKSGGRGEKGKGSALNSFTNQWKSKRSTKYFTNKTCYYPG